jgi:hypothetical protein
VSEETIVKKTVPERLKKLGKLYEERNKVYGNPFADFGYVLYYMFGGRLVLETPEEFGRFSLFMAHWGKMSRYSAAIKSGGHADSMDDLAVYAQILREFDDEWANRRKK